MVTSGPLLSYCSFQFLSRGLAVDPKYVQITSSPLNCAINYVFIIVNIVFTVLFRVNTNQQLSFI